MRLAAILVFALAEATSAQAQHDHGAMAGPSPAAMAGAPGTLQEVGQGAFAAISEAAAMLKADPNTDWSRANIDSLREHLVDMDNVTLRADVATRPMPGGARFEVTSTDPRVLASIRRLVPLHASMMTAEGPFQARSEPLTSGVAMIVTAGPASEAAKVRGLGFFGLLADGVHHPRHHRMLAVGEQMQH